MLSQACHRVDNCSVICWGLWETVQYTLHGMIKGEELGMYTGMPIGLCLRAAPGSGQSSALPAQLVVGWTYVGHLASATPTVSNGQRFDSQGARCRDGPHCLSVFVFLYHLLHSIRAGPSWQKDVISEAWALPWSLGFLWG